MTAQLIRATDDRADRLLAVLVERPAAAGLVKRRGRMRTDSKHVLAAVVKLNRVELVGEALRAAIEELADADEEWPAQLLDAGWAERYGRPVRYDRLPRETEKLAACVLQFGEDGTRLLREIHRADAPPRLRALPEETHMPEPECRRRPSASCTGRTALACRVGSARH